MVSLNGTTDGTTDGTTHGTTITIVNYGDYQDVGTTNGTTHGTTKNPQMVQPMGNRWATDGQTVPTYNHDNHDNHDNQYVGGELQQPTISQYQEIIRSWNVIPHTLNIDSIVPGTQREDEIRVVISMYGYDGLKRAIQSVKDSAYLQRVGHVRFDNYINRNTVQKLIEGAYDKDYQTEKDKEPKGKTTQFNSFEQRNYDYSALEQKLLGR